MPKYSLRLPGRVLDLLCLVLIVAALVVIMRPYLSTVYWLGDEGIILHGLRRMRDGETIYRDFFEYLPPGVFALTGAWLHLLPFSLLSARLFVVLMCALTAVATYLACRHAGGGRVLSAFLPVAWTWMSQGSFTQVNHHLISLPLSMLALLATLRALEAPGTARGWSFVAGLIAGATLSVTQHRGVLACIAAFASMLGPRERWRLLPTLILGGAVVPSLVVAGLLALGIAGDAFRDVVLFTLTRYEKIQDVPFGSWPTPANWPLVGLFPLALGGALLSVLLDWQRWRDDPRPRAYLAFAVAGLLGCFPRADTIHIAWCAPLGLPLLVYLLGRLATALQGWLRWAPATAVVLLCLPSGQEARWNASRVHRMPSVETALGEVRVPDAAHRMLLLRLGALPPRQAVFSYPYLPLLPVLTGHRHVARNDVFMQWFTSPEQFADACRAVMVGADWVVLDRKWMSPTFIRQVFPAMPPDDPPEFEAFNRAMEEGFELDASYGNFQLRRRSPAAEPALCAPILVAAAPPR